MKTIGPRVQLLKAARAPTLRTADRRITGRMLQARRFRLWSVSPYCVDCGRLTDYPQGFELDHDIPLEHGGPDTEANCRVRCVWYDEQGTKQGCHEAKTKLQARGRQ